MIKNKTILPLTALLALSGCFQDVASGSQPSSGDSGDGDATGDGDGEGDGDGSGDSGDGDGDSGAGDGDSTGDGDGDSDDPGYCGDGMVDSGEECDLGPNNGPDSPCLDGCVDWSCGDGYIYPEEEECDDGDENNGNECLNECILAACGDGFVHAGVEQCDDGNNVENDGCSQDCTLPSCGNGLQEQGEACDDGNGSDADSCTTLCSLPVCGDGFVWAGMEECDDGNEMDNDGCSSCLIQFCGDGIQQLGEECDDGNQANLDCCSSACAQEQKYVFVSSSSHTGNMAGYLGANAICNGLASNAGLPGTYKAWLSDQGGSPNTRMAHASCPYVRTDGVQVAADWSDLVDGSLDAPISLTESMQIPQNFANPCGNNPPTVPLVRSSTTWNGLLQSQAYSCANWTSTVGSALWGNANSTTQQWTAYCSSGNPSPSCASPALIYCVQQ